jgi:hypothetical protein
MHWYKSLSFNKYLILSFLLICIQKAPAQIVINEIAALNATGAYDPDFGEFSDYIELYNTGKQAVNLKGYTLTDQPGKPDQWVFPEMVIQAGGFLHLWADNRNKTVGDTAFCIYRQTIITTTALHTNFAFSGDGEYAGLFDPQGMLVDEKKFGVQQHDVFYGRNPEDITRWQYFGDATPGNANPPYGANNPVFSDEAIFSLNSGFYQGNQQLNLSSPVPGGQIRYTTDGSTPGHTSPLFSGTLNIDRTSTIKARVFELDKIPGPVVTRSYLINENIHLPVISISTNNDNFQDYDFGLLRNALKEREVPAVVEYFNRQHQPDFTINAGIRLFGSTIFQLPQRPLSIRFKAKYGEPELVYPLFEGRENQRYRSFLLRNGGNDHDLAYFRDGLAMNLAKNQMDLDLQDYQSCVVFINGEYHGIYEMRERMDEVHLANQHQLNSEAIDILEDSLNIAAGNQMEYRKFISFVEENDLSTVENFAYIQSKIDLNEYTNYLIHKIFIGYWLFDLNNRYWRPQLENARWRWIAADMEHAFGQLGGDQYFENTLAKVSGAEGELPEWSTLLFRKLLENKEFRDEFIQRAAAYMNGLYQPENTLAKVDSLQALLEPQMPRHIFKWKTPVNMNVWKGNIQFIREYLQNRPAHMRSHIAQQFGLTDSAKVTLRIEGKGKVAMAGVWHQNDSSSGYYFKGAALSLLAVPEHGHRFAGWDEQLKSANNLLLTGDTTLTARFEPETINIIPNVITSDFRLDATTGPWYATSNVSVLAGATLTIDAGTEILMSDGASLNIHGGLQINGEQSNRVNIHPDPSPAARKPIRNTKPRWGVICLQNASDTISIRHARISGSGFGSDRNKHFATVSSFQSVVNIEFTTIDDCFQPFYSEYGSVHISHSNFRSVNTCDLINVKYNTGAVVEYCDLVGNNAPDTDAIDYDGVIDGIIRGNKISGFRGYNSDGIDVGEASKNLLIENNQIENCTDKAISVGQASTIIASRNLITHCDLGIAVKDSFSIALVDQNTIYGITHAIACYEKNSGRGGGQAVVKNSILSGSMSASVWADELSSIAVSYSLSDTDTLYGTWNVFANPRFKNPSMGNFELETTSPCIDAGDPFSAKDPDQSRADMGAYYVHTGHNMRNVRINEINYHAASNYKTGDWIELYNQGEHSVDLSGWTISCQGNTFRFPAGEQLETKAYKVIAEDPDLFSTWYTQTENLVVEQGISLDNKMGIVSLRDEANMLVHAVRYSDYWPWPPLADGHGATLELEHMQEGNDDTDWRESYVLMGTPGAENSMGMAFGNIRINELMASNNSFSDEYGETDDWFELYNGNDFPVNTGGLYLTDKFIAPNKWQIPLNQPELTTIPPGGFMLIWADDQTQQGPLHASFKLSASGEELAIYQRFHLGYSDLDRITFKEQNPEQSYGRYSDGADHLMLLKPTPGASNVRTDSEEFLDTSVLVAPNPFSHYTRFNTQQLPKPFTISIFNASGNVAWKSGKRYDDQVFFERGSLNKGLYFYKVDAKGKAPFTGKIMIY